MTPNLVINQFKEKWYGKMMDTHRYKYRPTDKGLEYQNFNLFLSLANTTGLNALLLLEMPTRVEMSFMMGAFLSIRTSVFL